MTPSEIEDCFPQIAQVGYSITSPQTPRYNCIAWAAGDTRKMGRNYFPFRKIDD